LAFINIVIKLAWTGICEASAEIHEVIGMVREGLHFVETKNLKSTMVKINIFQSYDKVIGLYLRLMLKDLGVFMYFVHWVMHCVTSISFSFLINGAAFSFSKPCRGLKARSPFISTSILQCC
jgi:hypothetical protein